MKHVLVVLSNARDGEDDAFNGWYDGTHLGDVLQVPGFTAAQRFRLSDGQMGRGELPYRYLAIYEVDSDGTGPAADALRTSSGSMVIDESLDRDRTVAWFYTPITERVTA